jgi:hypothetical protein
LKEQAAASWCKSKATRCRHSHHGENLKSNNSVLGFNFISLKEVFGTGKHRHFEVLLSVRVKRKKNGKPGPVLH